MQFIYRNSRSTSLVIVKTQIFIEKSNHIGGREEDVFDNDILAVLADHISISAIQCLVVTRANSTFIHPDVR